MKKVNTGKVVTCKHCSKTIKDTVQEIKVPFWEAKDHSVSRVSEYCLRCANQEVQTITQVKCRRCARVYKRITVTSCRHQELRDRTDTKGYCSQGCERLERAGKAVDGGIEKAGEVLGRWGKKFGKGLRRGTR